MLAQTVGRLGGLVPVENIIVVTNLEQMEAVAEVCPQLPKENIIGEPMGRDTAPAVGLGALLVGRKDPDAVFAILPADHVIHDSKGFQSVLDSAFEAAATEPVLVTIGITPTFAATGYGYIHSGEAIGESKGLAVRAVHQFKEKPNLETAQGYVDSGEFFWNAGMFVWSVASVNAALAAHAPGLAQSLSALNSDLDAGVTLDAAMARHYPEMEKISVDFAIMEKADNVVVIQSRFDWDDVGEWPAISRHEQKDEAGNTIKGSTYLKGSAGNIVVSPDGHITALLGVEDLIVVHTSDATLVCHKDQAQNLKALVKEIGAEHPELM